MADDQLTSASGHFNPRCKARSTSQLLSPNSVLVQPLVSKSDRSTPHSSTSSLTMSTSSKLSLSSFLKVPLPSRKATVSQSSEDRFVMTIIKSPCNHSPRMPSTSSTDLVTPTTMASPTSEEVATNNKFFKSKVTAALNHMKYRKFASLLFSRRSSPS